MNAIVEQKKQINFWDIAEPISREWYMLACREPYAEFYIWWRNARKGERIAIPLVTKECPEEGYNKGIKLSGAWPREVCKRKIVESMNSLPILGN